MKVFISGGCKNGKSSYAESIAVNMSKSAKPLYYVATMKAVDDEDRERIKRHRNSRQGLQFETIECAKDISSILKSCKVNGTFLLDSITALLANEMFSDGGVINKNSHIKIGRELTELINKVDNIVIVSDYIYSDANIYDEYTESYKKALAYLDKICASLCDTVIEVCFGNTIIYKGKDIFKEVE